MDSKFDMTFSSDYLKTANEVQPIQCTENLTYQMKTKNECPTLLNFVARQGVTIKIQEKILQDAESCPANPIEVLEDSVDVMVSPANMTVDRRKKSWYWFLILATQKRVTDPTLPSCNSQNYILKLNQAEWLRNHIEIQEYLRM